MSKKPNGKVQPLVLGCGTYTGSISGSIALATVQVGDNSNSPGGYPELLAGKTTANTSGQFNWGTDGSGLFNSGWRYLQVTVGTLNGVRGIHLRVDTSSWLDYAITYTSISYLVIEATVNDLQNSDFLIHIENMEVNGTSLDCDVSAETASTFIRFPDLHQSAKTMAQRILGKDSKSAKKMSAARAVSGGGHGGPPIHAMTRGRTQITGIPATDPMQFTASLLMESIDPDTPMPGRSDIIGRIYVFGT